MHDIKWIREQPADFVAALSRRGGDSEDAKMRADLLVKKLQGLDEQRRAAVTALENVLSRRNAASKEIGQAKAAKDDARAQELMAEVSKLKAQLPDLESEVRTVEAMLDDALSGIPNAPLADVPLGVDETGNIEREDHRYGAPRTYSFTPRQHFEIGEGLGQMDFEKAARMSGARFVVNMGPLARLERALGQFFLDMHTAEHGYMEVNPPILVRDEAMYGTAQLPKFENDQFPTFRTEEFDEALAHAQEAVAAQAAAMIAQGMDPKSALEKSNLAAQVRKAQLGNRLWLVPTAEVPLTNLVRESIIAEEELPLRLTALTQCFRAEAGSAGRDTRGMIRQHQFTKVEMVSITTPESSLDELERMLSCAEAVLKKLDLPFRVMTLCTGDMGFASRKTYDIEVWLPGQQAYREISSCSVCGDFQARRMNARYRPKADKTPRFVHTLNGSGVAVGRALVAVLENYQQENGTVAVPDALAPYMGGLKVIEKLS
ncbi:serine--tRNA ligase [Xanthobacter sp. TB0136]|uniref:serine--tRNA ligase n=1 Tax=Xanthobacter sp. TB0136 TaxID=3459177 RepID=UPI0040396A0A